MDLYEILALQLIGQLPSMKLAIVWKESGKMTKQYFISRDGIYYKPCANLEIDYGTGFYSLNLTAEDMDGDKVFLSPKECLEEWQIVEV